MLEILSCSRGHSGTQTDDKFRLATRTIDIWDGMGQRHPVMDPTFSKINRRSSSVDYAGKQQSWRTCGVGLSIFHSGKWLGEKFTCLTVIISMI